MKQPRLFIIFKTENSKLYGEIVAIDISEDATLLSSGFLFCFFFAKLSAKHTLKKNKTLNGCISLHLFSFSVVMHLKCGK